MQHFSPTFWFSLSWHFFTPYFHLDNQYQTGISLLEWAEFLFAGLLLVLLKRKEKTEAVKSPCRRKSKACHY
jgi:hypothetical protein